MKILVTGSGGFIGFHLSKYLLEKKHIVFGYDNMNSYYDVKLKKDRIKILSKSNKFFFTKGNLQDFKRLDNLVKKNKIKKIIHLAAQAGVRHSVKNPRDYFNSNIEGFFNILETSKINKIEHLLFASTSSVYGDGKNFPLKESENTDHPLSFYAATKKSNEVMAYAYSHIYNLPVTGLRFFTVYGPYGRPDMALFKFIKNMMMKKPIELYNKGNHIRDFTYVDDVVVSISKLINKPPNKKVPYDVFNIAGNEPRHLKDFLRIIEKYLNIKPKVKLLKMQIGDVHKTDASVNKLINKIKFKPKIKAEEGILKFIDWYKNQFNQGSKK